MGNDALKPRNGHTLLTPAEIAGNRGRIEQPGPQGRIIHARDVNIGAGLYGDSNGLGRCAIHVQDPKLGGGERRVYLIPKDKAVEIANGLMLAAGRAAS